MAEYNFSELVDELAEKLNLDTDDAREFLTTTFDVITNRLVEQKRVEFKPLGTLKLNLRKARSGKTVLGGGTEWSLPERYVVDFKPSPTFLRGLNERKQFTETITKG